jgi:hypothetical protein
MGEGTGEDYVVVQYNGGNGNQNFNLRYNGPANADDIPTAIISSGGAVYVTGSSKAAAKGSDFTTIKYVDLSKVKYRSFPQDSLGGAAVNLKLGGTIPNAANVRDESFPKAYPKIKPGFAGAPGGLVMGNARPDSAMIYGWIRIDKGRALMKLLPSTGRARGLDSIGGKLFLGEKKNPTVAKYNNHLVGALAALRINVGASDAEVTPPTFGDLTYNDGDTSNHFNGVTLRDLATLIDNYLTYWKKYPPINWALLDSMVSRTNRAFMGPGPSSSLPWVSRIPLVVTGVVPADSTTFLTPSTNPLLNPLSFPPGSLDLTPMTYTLYQNYPNPFNPTTTIEFDLPQPSVVTLKVYDILGREVVTLLDEVSLDQGNHDVEFNAQNLASGVYFYRLIANDGQFRLIKKMMLMK